MISNIRKSIHYLQNAIRQGKYKGSQETALRVLDDLILLDQDWDLPNLEKPSCDVCGSDDVIEAPHMGRNCNFCNPL